jgi:glycosyltransferase involved in cell wall biosynthesis
MTNLRTTRTEGGRRLRKAARSTPPLVSIIVVMFRAAQELPPLLESIVAQRGEDTELIVIDGGSDDGTLDIIRRFEDSIDYWISEPDRGIYDAMNKGIAAATGEYVLHLNAGDRLKCIPRESLLRCRADGIDVACFTVDTENCGEFRPRTGFILRILNVWHHQGTFYRRQSHPGYDIQYRVFSDFDCNQKMLKANKSVALFRQVVAEQSTVGISGTGVADGECYHIIRKNFGIHYVVLAFFYKDVVCQLADAVQRLRHKR